LLSLRGPKGRGNLLHHWQKALIAVDIGFVFTRCQITKIAISHCEYWINSILPFQKLGLFFQTPFRSTQNAARNTNKLALFSLPKPPKTTQASINPYYYRLNAILPILTLALFLQIMLVIRVSAYQVVIIRISGHQSNLA